MIYKFYSTLPAEAKRIREEVFVKEQKFKEEFDLIDEKSTHLVVFSNDNKPLGTARMYPKENDKKTIIFGRIAVLKSARGLNIGKAIMNILENEAKREDYKFAELSSQLQASDFYKRCGFEVSSNIYLDEYCEHVKMTKQL